LGAIAAYLLRSRLPEGPVGSSIPGLSALANAVRGEPGGVVRGFGDTVLRYRDRSYDGSQWRVLENTQNLAAPAGLPAGKAPILTTITGWDRDDFWVAGSTTQSDGVLVLLRCRAGKWSVEGRGRDTGTRPHAIRLTGRDTGVLAAEAWSQDRVWVFTPAGVSRPFVLDNSFIWGYSEVAPVGPDEAYVMDRRRGVLRISAGRHQAVEGAAALLHTGEPLAPNSDYLLSNLLHARSPRAGDAFAVFPHEGWEGRRIGRYRDGKWVDAGRLSVKGAMTGLWLGGGEDDRFVIVVGPSGAVSYQTIGGAAIDQPVPTSADLMAVWGVSPEKYWVMDQHLGVWERSGNVWKQVVPARAGVVMGRYREQDIWVAPDGAVTAVTGTEILRLD
jgi:hypothetical protein